ncbi:integrase core domain-containing protein [Micromonospora sp. NPDC050200]|uniref:integrase core domain-containing protein n=1 Tax=Micromonospora sp. NPDC050200 TaxID=3155664 RepID=UPI0033F28C58
MLQSMGRVGSALDNAAAEAFNSTIKVEYIHRQRFRTRAEARTKISTWIVDFYNVRRRHSACDGMPPIDYELFRPRLGEPKPLNEVLHDSGD